MSTSADIADIQARTDKAVDDLVSTFTFEISGDESLAEIIRLAGEEWDADEALRELAGRNRRGPRRQQFRPADDRLAVDFLRHQRTAYDYQLDQVRDALYWIGMDVPNGEDGELPREVQDILDDASNRGARTIRAQTLAAIATKYPALANAVAHRAQSTYTVIGGSTMHVGRMPSLH